MENKNITLSEQFLHPIDRQQKETISRSPTYKYATAYSPGLYEYFNTKWRC